MAIRHVYSGATTTGLEARLSQCNLCTPLFLTQENIFTVPNVLSVGRIILSPALGYFVVSESYKLALTFFVLAGVSDMVRAILKL